MLEEGNKRTYIFSGKVFPERAAVNVSDPVELRVQAKDGGFSAEVIISVGVSQVSVVVKTGDEIASLATLKNTVESLVRVEMDALGYLWGRGYDVEITSVVGPDDKQTVFGVGISALEADQDERPLSYGDLIKLAVVSQYLRRALGDLREAIRSPIDTGFFCYGAVESIRQGFVTEEDGDKKKPSWERLSSALRIDQSWANALKEFGDSQRHRQPVSMSEEDRVFAMQHAWKVVDRFCVYAHRGNEQLPEAEFEILRENES